MRDGNEPVKDEEEVEQGKMLAAQITAKTCSLNIRKTCGMLILPQCSGMFYIHIYFISIKQFKCTWMSNEEDTILFAPVSLFLDILFG